MSHCDNTFPSLLTRVHSRSDANGDLVSLSTHGTGVDEAKMPWGIGLSTRFTVVNWRLSPAQLVLLAVAAQFFDLLKHSTSPHHSTLSCVSRRCLGRAPGKKCVRAFAFGLGNQLKWCNMQPISFDLRSSCHVFTPIDANRNLQYFTGPL